MYQSPPDSYNPLFLAKSPFSPCGPSIWCHPSVWQVSALQKTFFFPGKDKDKMMLHIDIRTVSAGPGDARRTAYAWRCLSYPTQPLFPKPDLESIPLPNSRGPGQGSAGGEGASEHCRVWARTDPTLIDPRLLKTWARSQIKLGLKEGFFQSGSSVSQDKYGWLARKSYKKFHLFWGVLDAKCL